MGASVIRAAPYNICLSVEYWRDREMAAFDEVALEMRLRVSQGYSRLKG